MDYPFLSIIIPAHNELSHPLRKMFNKPIYTVDLGLIIDEI